MKAVLSTQSYFLFIFQLKVGHGYFSHTKLLHFARHGFREIVPEEPVLWDFKVRQLKPSEDVGG